MMRPRPRAWLPLVLLAVLGRAANGAFVEDEASPLIANQAGAAGSLQLAAPMPVLQLPSIVLQPNVAFPGAAAAIYAPLAAASVPQPAPSLARQDFELETPAPPASGGSSPARAALPEGKADLTPDPNIFDGRGGGAKPDVELDPAAGRPEPTFEEKARAIRVASSFKFATGPRSRSVLEWRRETIDGLPAKEIDGLGQANAGVYRYTRDGRRRVLKILTQNTDEDYPEDYPDYPAEVQLRAGAVGTVFGAPRILRSGTIRVGPYEKYYIEMEEIFPGAVSRGFKDALNSPGKAAWVRSLSRPANSGEAPVARIARMIVSVLEHGVVPYDGDFLVTEDGRVSWIDANFWALDENARFPKYHDKLLREMNYFFRSFAEDPATGRIFAREFLSALKRSRRIPKETKDAIMDNWVEHDSKALEAVGISGSTELRSFYNGLADSAGG